MSDDGTVVIGNSGWKPPLDAFIFTDDTKMIKLSDYLAAKGVVIPQGWSLVTATAITPDGKNFAGTALNLARVAQGYVATIF